MKISIVKPILLIVIAIFLILGCDFPYPFTWLTTMDEIEKGEPTKPSAMLPSEELATAPVKPSNVPGTNETADPALPVSFLPSDCSVGGFSFENITTDFNTNDPFDGPLIICNSTSAGSNGLNEIYHVDVHTIKPEFLNSSFEEQKSVWKPFIDDSIKWREKNPTAGTEVVTIQDNETGYIYLILTDANVQKCQLGEGYGTEIIDSYLVNLQFSSCESDKSAYMLAIEMLRDTARKAIKRVEENE